MKNPQLDGLIACKDWQSEEDVQRRKGGRSLARSVIKSLILFRYNLYAEDMLIVKWSKFKPSINYINTCVKMASMIHFQLTNWQKSEMKFLMTICFDSFLWTGECEFINNVLHRFNLCSLKLNLVIFIYFTSWK